MGSIYLFFFFAFFFAGIGLFSSCAEDQDPRGSQHIEAGRVRSPICSSVGSTCQAKSCRLPVVSTAGHGGKSWGADPQRCGPGRRFPAGEEHE